jgi:Rrf2 family protein
MMLLPRRALLAIAAVVDVAIHARPAPVAAKALAARHNLPPRHLETLLQTLVRANILKGVRGPRGGYELARERRRVSVGEIVRAARAEPGAEEGGSILVDQVIAPVIDAAGAGFLAALDQITIDELCQKARMDAAFGKVEARSDFTI